MKIFAMLLTLKLLLFTTSAEAAPPDTCAFFTVDEINKFAKGGDAVRAEKRSQGTESQCNWLRKSGDNVFNLTLRESTNAAADYKLTVKTYEAIYKKPVKPIAGLGDEAWWGDNLRMLTFRKGSLIVNLSWGGSQYGDEASVVNIAKAVAGKLK